MTRKSGAETTGPSLTDARPPRGVGDELVVHGLTLIPGDGPVVNDGAVWVRRGLIAAIGPSPEVRAKAPTALVVNGAGFTAIPGLINAHVHSAMSFFRDLGHGQDEMIERFFFPAEKALTPELIEPLAYSYLYAGLRSGVTCFGDHYYFVAGVGRALDRLGLRGVIGETVADLGGAFPGRQGWEDWRRTIDAWPFSSRVRPAIAPHATDTVSEPLLTELATFARQRQLPLHMHLSQTIGERQRVMGRARCSPVEYARRCGALSAATLAVHLVTIDEDDARTLQTSGVTAGLCPASQILYESLAPMALIARSGIPVALGTDCAASNDTADMLAEMRLTALLAQDRGVLPAQRSPAAILRMATSNGARGLGLGEVAGSLSVGKAADMVFLAPDLATLPQPRPDVNVVFSMSQRQVRHVMVDGRFVLYDGSLTMASEGDLTREYQAAVQTIWGRLGAGFPP